MLVIRSNFLLFIFLILLPFSFVNDSKSQELDILFDKLSKVKDPYIASSLEKKIWAIWSKHPKNEKLTNKLEFGKNLMNEGSYNYALKVFSNIIKSDPKWSEAWDARATLLFYMKDYESSLSDIDKVLYLEPRHFGALSGRAQISIRLRDYENAILDLKKVKELIPTSNKSELIKELTNLVKGLNI